MKCTRDRNQNPTRTPVIPSPHVLELPYSASKEPTRWRRHPVQLNVAPRPTGRTYHRHTLISGAASMLPQLQLPSGPGGARSEDEQLRGCAFGLLRAWPTCLHRRSSAPQAPQSSRERGRRRLPWEGMVSRTSRGKNTKSQHHQLETCN